MQLPRAGRLAHKTAPAAEVCLRAITRDPDLFARIVATVSPWGWETRELSDPRELCPEHIPTTQIQVVVLDSEAVGDWKESVAEIRACLPEVCIVLISPVADDFMWRELIRCGGYDLVGKLAGPEHLSGTLRFAWLWKRGSNRI